MAYSTKSISERLFDAEHAINNSLAYSEILSVVTPFGYDQTRLETARALYEQARELTNVQKKEYGDQYEATQAVQEAWDKAAVAYSAALKIARIAFKGERGAREALGLGGVRKKSLSGWIDQADRFYDNMLSRPEYITVMSTYGYDQPKIEAEYALVKAVQDASKVQDHERGEAQEATLARDAVLDELDEWMFDYKTIAEVAFADSPQILEQLGWVVKS